jgi:uncharacterized membrane protein
MEAEMSFILVELVLTIFLGGFFLLYPMIVRKGLLFGVYVGENAFDSDKARGITRSYYRWMIGAILVSVVVGIGALLVSRNPIAILAPILIQLIAFLIGYLRAYFRARAIAPAGPPAAAEAALVPPTAAGTALPLIALVTGAVLGLVSIGYAWMHYPDLPSIVPTHFGISGKPDAWRPKSFATVMLLPLMSLFMGIGISGIAWLTSRAKRALRLSDRGVSLEAQVKFRSALARFLSGVAMLTALMLAFLSVMSIQVGLGWRPGLAPQITAVTFAFVAYVIGGTLYIAIRYGQGGARLERGGPGTPLTDGLADNRKWVLGMFYVDRDDPSFFVERRFGFGYTLNFGNWKAVALLVAFLAIILVITITAVLTN